MFTANSQVKFGDGKKGNAYNSFLMGAYFIFSLPSCTERYFVLLHELQNQKGTTIAQNATALFDYHPNQ